MSAVYVVADNIFSPLGDDTTANFEAVKTGTSGIREVIDARFGSEPFYASAFADFPEVGSQLPFTRFESICIASITEALSHTDITLAGQDTIFILSSTKGNIDLLEGKEMTEALRTRISLSATAGLIAGHFHAVNSPLVVSSACISGVAAITLAQRLLTSGRYRHAVITGADILSGFVVSGFRSLSAMSAGPCRPFDKDRTGVNLGECAATVILSADKGHSKIQVRSGAITNDANHISGPSRTGAELSAAIDRVIKDSQLSPDQLSFISAHGTATVYNDEMEAKAFHLSGLSHVPAFSLKANLGHTLGAAGVVESILAYRALQEGIILPSKNFTSLGVSQSIAVSTSVTASGKRHALKTASGFGGCNAAVIYSLTETT